MKFSLILCTLNRTMEVKRFLEALSCQEYKIFELIVVDQNKNDSVQKLLVPYEKLFSIKYLNSPLGLSKGRNIAMPHVTGDIIAIPDDDCVYPKTLLKDACTFFCSSSHDGLILKIKNYLNNGFVLPYYNSSKTIGIMDAFSTASCAIFFHRKIYNSIGLFDENLGPGTHSELIGGDRIKILGGEDIDIIIRAINGGFSCYYNKDIEVMHPYPNLAPGEGGNKEALESYFKRTESAGASDYYVFKKHFPFLKRWFIIFNNIAGIFFSLFFRFDFDSSLRHFHRCKGIFYALRQLKKQKHAFY